VLTDIVVVLLYWSVVYYYSETLESRDSRLNYILRVDSVEAVIFLHSLFIVYCIIHFSNDYYNVLFNFNVCFSFLT